MSRAPASHRNAFGFNLRQALQAAGVSRKTLAQHLGLHQRTIGNWIRGERDCPVGWVPQIAEALGIAPSTLLAPTSSAPNARGQTRQIVEAGSERKPPAQFALHVVDVLERPLTTPDLMGLLAEARALLDDGASTDPTLPRQPD